MQCSVIVRPESPTRFVARAVGLPELESIAPSEAETADALTPHPRCKRPCTELPAWVGFWGVRTMANRE
jgi:hypothetical protein